jgi:hypothetical protein
MPSVQTIGTNAPSSGILGVSVQGSSASIPGDAAPTMMSLDPYTPENRTLELYARGSGTVDFTITPSVPYIRVLPSTGTISYPSGTSDMRATIRVDWASAPQGTSTASITIKPSRGTEVKLSLPLNNFQAPTNFAGCVESSGAVAIEMQHFVSRTPGSGGSTVEVIPNYGRTDSGLTVLPASGATMTPSTAPKAVYNFYAVSSAANAKVSVYMPPSFNVDPGAPFKYAIALDNGTPTTVAPVSSSTLGAMPGDWRDSVINGARVASTNVGRVERGLHSLSLWLLEPGTTVHRLVVDLGGVKSSYLGPPESSKLGM